MKLEYVNITIQITSRKRCVKQFDLSYPVFTTKVSTKTSNVEAYIVPTIKYILNNYHLFRNFVTEYNSLREFIEWLTFLGQEHRYLIKYDNSKFYVENLNDEAITNLVLHYIKTRILKTKVRRRVNLITITNLRIDLISTKKRNIYLVSVNDLFKAYLVSKSYISSRRIVSEVLPKLVPVLVVQ